LSTGATGATSSSAPGRVMSGPEERRPKSFSKLFIKIDGVNRRLSDLSAYSLEDFALQLRNQLPNVSLPHSPQFELYDDDADDYFLIEKWSVFKDDNPIVKIRLLLPSPDPVGGDDDDDDFNFQDDESATHDGDAGPQPALSRRGSRAAVVLSSSPVVTHPAARHASQPRMSPVVLRMASPSKRSGSTPVQRSPMVAPGSPGALFPNRATGSPLRMRTAGHVVSNRLQLLDGTRSVLENSVESD
jgi:hypothetical protein